MAVPINIRVTWLAHGRGLSLPAYQTAHAAGMDLLAAVAEDQPLLLQPMDRVACPCGFAMALPEGYEAQVRPRSGMALKQGLSMPNAPGTIDADYRGEVKVLLINLGREPIAITRGMRIAQMVVAKVEKAVWSEFETLPKRTGAAAGLGARGHDL